MKFLLWFERHFAWMHWDALHEASGSPVVDEMFAQAGPRQARSTAAVKTKRTVLLNIGTSVGGAVIIGALSGILASGRLTQRVTDSLAEHDRRLSVIEQNYVPKAVHSEKDRLIVEQFAQLNKRNEESREENLNLRHELNELVLKQGRP